jgi:DNA-binding response OmpR family regulator
MPLGKVLVVEDDEAIRRGLVDALGVNNYEVLEAGDGRSGLATAIGCEVDIVLLDIMMPGMDGMAVLRELRKAKPSLPVIFLTAKGDAPDRVKGLRQGADDYIAKPFSLAELLARIEAVLRRSAERPRAMSKLIIAGREIDFDRREAILPDGTIVKLPQREAEVLAYLAANPGRAVSRDELLSRVWGFDPRGVATRTVDMAVARIREQLQDDPTEPSVVATVRGRGYMLVRAEEAEIVEEGA